jgi:N6-adenosine-specific RNA methylase IME4
MLDFSALAGQQFPVIYADPPWTFATSSDKGKGRSAERHYRIATLDDIKALPVQQIAADDCALFLWATWPSLYAALDVIEAWGFRYRTLGFIWVKQTKSGAGLHTGLGFWTRANSEPCLLAARGRRQRQSAGVHSVIQAPVRQHSRKPSETYDRIEALLAGPYLELFSRTERPGWTMLGDEVGKWSSDGGCL